MSNLDFINDILSKSIISRKEIIGDTIFVDTNPSRLEFTTIKKVKGEIEKTTEVVNYELRESHIKTDKLTDYGLIYEVSILLDKEFIKSFENNFCLDEVNFYPPFILRPFKRFNTQLIIDEISNYSWVLTTEKIIKHLRKYNNFQDISDNLSSTIKLKGKIGQTFIFISDEVEKDTIWTGNYNNCLAIILKDIYIKKEDNIYDIKIEYLFNTKGIRKLSLM